MRVGCPKGISWHFRKTESPQEEKLFSYYNLLSQPTRPRFMKENSVNFPALKGLLDRPLDLGTVELMERAMRAAGFVGPNWSYYWGNRFRSLKPHGSSPGHVLDLLLVLEESSDEKMQQMDLDDVTVEQVAAARSALREVIGKLELVLKTGEIWWNFRQVAPWLFMGLPYLGSNHLPMLQAMDARASILMTRLEEEAEKENHATCLKEVAFNSFGIFFWFWNEEFVFFLENLTLRWNEELSLLCGF